MSVDRSCHPAIPCSYGERITKAHANSNVPVILSNVVNGKNEFPQVEIQAAPETTQLVNNADITSTGTIALTNTDLKSNPGNVRVTVSATGPSVIRISGNDENGIAYSDHEDLSFSTQATQTSTRKYSRNGLTVAVQTAGASNTSADVFFVETTEGVEVYGELLDVFPETKTCTVQYEGLMYLRALAAYATDGSDNGKAVAMSGTENQVTGVSNAQASNAPIIEGGYTENTDEYYYKCRR